MAQDNQSLTIYRLRVSLLRTSPHVWRRILVRPSTSLIQLDRTIACAFGWLDIDPHRFLIQVRLERIIPAEAATAYPRCTEGKGSPPLDQISNPVELAELAELFTPRYIVHRLAELVNHNADDVRTASELRHLRPWLDRDRFKLHTANRRLQQMEVRP